MSTMIILFPFLRWSFLFIFLISVVASPSPWAICKPPPYALTSKSCHSSIILPIPLTHFIPHNSPMASKSATTFNREREEGTVTLIFSSWFLSISNLPQKKHQRNWSTNWLNDFQHFPLGEASICSRSCLGTLPLRLSFGNYVQSTLYKCYTYKC